MEIYQLKLVLRGISPRIWRRLLIPANTSLADLHRIIQTAMGWEGWHLHRFRIHGQDLGLTSPGGISFTDDPHQVRLSQFRLRPGERFLYEYDFTDRWLHDVRLEAVLPAKTHQFYPACTAGKYACPPEDCGGVENFLGQRRVLAATQIQDWRVMVENAERMARCLKEDRPLGLNQNSEEYAALAVAVARTEAREHLTAQSFDRREVNHQLRAMCLSCEVSDAVRDPGGVHR